MTESLTSGVYTRFLVNAWLYDGAELTGRLRVSPSPFVARFAELNRECRHAGLAIAPVGQRIDQSAHSLSEGNQFCVW